MSQAPYLGLDVGATTIRGGLGDEGGLEAFEPAVFDTADYLPERGLDAAVLSVLDHYDLSLDELKGIGIGVPGLVDSEKKTVYSANIGDISLEGLEEFDKYVRIESDASAAVLGEISYGDGQEFDSVVTLMIGSGVGGGVYYQGDLLGSGKDGRSPEPAGFPVEENISWEDALGGENIPDYVENKILGSNESLNSDSAEEVFSSGCEELEGTKWIDHLSSLNVNGIETVIDAYAPELITVSGSVAVENPGFIEKSFDKVRDRDPVNPIPEMKISVLGNDLGLYGAMALAQEDLFPEAGIEINSY